MEVLAVGVRPAGLAEPRGAAQLVRHRGCHEDFLPLECRRWWMLFPSLTASCSDLWSRLVLVEVPKLSTLTRIFARAFVLEPQTAAQLVEVPVLSLDDCFFVPQGVEQLVELPPIVSQLSFVLPRSSARMAKQRVEVPKSRSRALKCTDEQIGIPALGGDSSSGYGVLRTFPPCQKSATSAQADVELQGSLAHRRQGRMSGGQCR